MSSKYVDLASNIINNVGGKENVLDLRHCVTRLRFRLKDESKANDEILKEMDGVVTVVKAMGEYMVVIGEHVADVYDEVCLQLGFKDMAGNLKPEEPKEKQKLIDRALGLIMASMGPTLNLLCACGIIKGITVIALVFGLDMDSGVYQLLNAAGDSLFYCMPLVLGFNAAKKSEIDPYFGLLLGAALTYPAIQGVDLSFFGHVVNATYTSSFLPILFGLIAAVPLYKFVDKHMPEVIKGFMTPLITLLIIFPITFIVIGPLANLIGVGINYVLNFIFDFSPIVGGLVLGGLWQVLVMFGIHGVLVMFAFYDLIAGNPSVIIAISSVPCFAAAGTLLAIYIRAKNPELKGIGLSSFVSAIFGVTEPGMYGVILPRKKLFVITCLGGAIGGLIIGIFGLKMYTYAGMGIIGILGMINPENANFIGIALAVVVPFVFTLLLTLSTFKEDDSVKITEAKKNNGETHNITMPIDGVIQPISKCSDETFACENLGKGCLIIPRDGQLFAPVSGTIRTLFPTKHAIGIVSDEGVEILIHVGINTVNLEGEFFETFVSQGDRVEKGQRLLAFDQTKIEAAGYNLETPIIITNTDNYLDIVELTYGDYNRGDTIMKVIG